MRLPQCLNLTTSKTKQFREMSWVFKVDNIKTKQFCETSSIFELNNVKNETILRDFFFLNLTTSKTKQFCETSSSFELDNIKIKAILRDFLQKLKVECSADGLVPMRFAIFPLHLSKVLRLPRKIDARSYEVLHQSRKIIVANLQIWCSKMQPFSGNQRPDLLTSLMNMSCVLRLPCDMHLCRSSSNVPRLPSFLQMLQNPHVLLTFEKVHNPLRLPRETTSEPPIVVRTPGVSSSFELDNIKIKAILRDFFKFWTWQHQNQSNSARLPSKIESWVQRWRPRTNAFCDFSTPPV